MKNPLTRTGWFAVGVLLGVLLVMVGSLKAATCDPAAFHVKDLTGTVGATVQIQGTTAPVVGLYDNSSHAYAACNANRISQGWGTCADNWNGVTCQANCPDPTKYNAQAQYEWNKGHHVYIYPKAAAVSGRDYKACPADADGDGLNDDIDPFPQSNEPFEYKLRMVGKNAAGMVVAKWVEFPDGSYYVLGNKSLVASWEAQVGGGWKPSTQWANEFAGIVEWAPTDNNPLNTNIPTTFGAQTFNTGNDNTGNTETNHYLADVVENTKQALGNQGKQNVTLEQIRDGIGTTNKLLETLDGGGGGGGGASAGDIGDAVGEKLDQQDEAAAESLEGANWGPDGNYTGYTQDDVPEKPLLMGAVLTSYMQQHPFAHLTDNSSLNVAGSNCKFTVTLLNRNIDFSLCNYANQAGVMGSMILSLAGIYAVFIIMGRA